MEQNIQQLLTILSDRLGTSTGHILESTKRQIPAWLVSEFLAVSLMCSVIAVAIFWIWKNTRVPEPTEYDKKYDRSPSANWDSGDATMAKIITGCVAVVFITLMISGIPMWYAAIFNPDYWALTKILGR